MTVKELKEWLEARDNAQDKVFNTHCNAVEKSLDAIDRQLRAINGRSKHNSWNIRALWGIVTTELGLFVWWVRNQFSGG